MLDDLAADSGGALVPLDDLLGAGDLAGADVVHAARRSEGLVLEFPVEVEVRLVSPLDPEQLASATIHTLIAALDGLA